MKTEQEIKSHLLEKAVSDAAFRTRLVADPRATFEQEFDIAVPEGFNVHVHEETATSAHLVLPAAGGPLDSGELDVVAGGKCVGGPAFCW